MKPSTIHRMLAAATLATAAVATAPAAAQSFPSRPITMILPYAPGGISDQSARVLAAGMSQALGQSVVVENRAGAGGKIGAEAMMRAPKDGYTIGLMNHAIASQLAVMDPAFKVQPEKDYAPIGLFSETYFALMANPKAPFKTVRELVSYAKANPGKLSYGSSGVGTGSHLGFELLKQTAGISVVHIPYRGEAPAMSDLMAGQVQLMLLTGTAKPYVADGRLRGLATTGAQRWNQFPELPTMHEAGIKDFVLRGWFGLAAPAGTPRSEIMKLNEAMRSALNNPATRAKFEALGNTVRLNSPEQLTKYITDEMDTYRKVVKFANITLQ